MLPAKNGGIAEIELQKAGSIRLKARWLKLVYNAAPPAFNADCGIYRLFSGAALSSRILAKSMLNSRAYSSFTALI